MKFKMMNISLFHLVFGLLLVTSLIKGLDDFKQSECGYSKSCLRWSSCDFANCDFAASWKEITYNGSKYLQIELVGLLTATANGYVALGFSLQNNMVILIE